MANRYLEPIDEERDRPASLAIFSTCQKHQSLGFCEYYPCPYYIDPTAGPSETAGPTSPAGSSPPATPLPSASVAASRSSVESSPSTVLIRSSADSDSEHSSIETITATQSTSALLLLPIKLRKKIHTLVLCSEDSVTLVVDSGRLVVQDDGVTRVNLLAITAVSKKMRNEATPLFYSGNRFVMAAVDAFGDMAYDAPPDSIAALPFEWSTAYTQWLRDLRPTKLTYLRVLDVDLGTWDLADGTWELSTPSGRDLDVARAVADIKRTLASTAILCEVTLRVAIPTAFETPCFATLQIPLTGASDTTPMALVDDVISRVLNHLEYMHAYDKMPKNIFKVVEAEVEGCQQRLKAFIEVIEAPAWSGLSQSSSLGWSRVFGKGKGQEFTTPPSKIVTINQGHPSELAATSEFKRRAHPKSQGRDEIVQYSYPFYKQRAQSPEEDHHRLSTLTDVSGITESNDGDTLVELESPQILQAEHARSFTGDSIRLIKHSPKLPSTSNLRDLYQGAEKGKGKQSFQHSPTPSTVSLSSTIPDKVASIISKQRFGRPSNASTISLSSTIPATIPAKAASILDYPADTSRLNLRRFAPSFRAPSITAIRSATPITPSDSFRRPAPPIPPKNPRRALRPAPEDIDTRTRNSFSYISGPVTPDNRRNTFVRNLEHDDIYRFPVVSEVETSVGVGFGREKARQWRDFKRGLLPPRPAFTGAMVDPGATMMLGSPQKDVPEREDVGRAK